MFKSSNHFEIWQYHSHALCQFQDSWIILTNVMYEQDFAWFEFMMCFQQTSYIAQHPRLQEVPLSMYLPDAFTITI